MSLPVPNLDDRSFQDLVDEAKRLIPTYCPEWTNHNLSDPGVALIELFAWMTEMALFRLNQVPDAFYTRMLNMLGFEPFGAAAARAQLTFWLVDVVGEPVVVPAGTQVSTAGELGSPRVFTTSDDLAISKPELTAALVSGGDGEYTDVWEALRVPNLAVVCFPHTPASSGDELYLGFAQSLAGNAVAMDIAANIEGIGVVPTNPPLRWEVWEGNGWVAASVYRDTTGGMNRDGKIVLLVPPVHEPLTLSGERAYWLRARALEPEPGQPAYQASPQIRAIDVSSIGGSVAAEHSDKAPREVLGRSSGKPDQVFEVRHRPVLRRAADETIEVHDEGLVTEWTEVADFVRSGADDRHFVWDSAAGLVRFGPLIRYPDGSSRQHGAVPPQDAQIVATGYRFGGGATGNVGPGTLTRLRTSLPYVDRVENIGPATGGVDAETVENAKLRGPQSLRSGARAVTVEDFERLAAEADPSVARVRCLPPLEAGRPIRLLVVPAIERPGETLALDDFALSDAMVARLSAHLDERRILGTSIEIGAPYYQGVTIAALVTARPGRPTTLVRERTLAVLYRYLNPLTGGPHGTGWPFDADLNSANVFQLLEAVEGVERVDEVLFFEHDLRNHERLGYGKELVKLERDSLFLSAHHQVVVR